MSPRNVSVEFPVCIHQEWLLINFNTRGENPGEEIANSTAATIGKVAEKNFRRQVECVTSYRGVPVGNYMTAAPAASDKPEAAAASEVVTT